MGVRPPQQGDDAEPETIAFGIAALDGYLDQGDVSFPTTQNELVEATGNPDIPFDAKGNEIPLRRALDNTQTTEFETRQDLMNALHPVFEAKRERANNSVIGRIRSLLPF